jgi:hypothetical protein
VRSAAFVGVEFVPFEKCIGSDEPFTTSITSGFHFVLLGTQHTGADQRGRSEGHYTLTHEDIFGA